MFLSTYVPNNVCITSLSINTSNSPECCSVKLINSTHFTPFSTSKIHTAKSGSNSSCLSGKSIPVNCHADSLLILVDINALCRPSLIVLHL